MKPKFFTSETRMAPGSPRERRIIIAAVLTALVLVILDQTTKLLVLRYIEAPDPAAHRITVIPGFFDLTHITNKGAAWGMFHDWPWIPAAISGVAFVLMIVYYIAEAEGWRATEEEYETELPKQLTYYAENEGVTTAEVLKKYGEEFFRQAIQYNKVLTNLVEVTVIE